VTRRALFLGVSIALALSAADARAQDQEECIKGYEEGQRLQLDGKLRAARSQLMVCARASCPRVTQSDCAKWLTALEPKVPSVIITAKDASGRDLENVNVTVDGEVVAERLEGRAIDVDPGGHTFRFESEGRVLEQRYVIVEGDKARRIAIELPSSTAYAPKDAVPSGPPDRDRDRASPSRIPTISWVLGGVAIVGLTSFTVFGLMGKNVESCVPRCTNGDVDDYQRDYVVADVSLGIALVAAGAAVYFALTQK
jgi:hypothetical protein